jgi:hypothetical protein
MIGWHGCREFCISIIFIKERCTCMGRIGSSVGIARLHCFQLTLFVLSLVEIGDIF